MTDEFSDPTTEDFDDIVAPTEYNVFPNKPATQLAGYTALASEAEGEELAHVYDSSKLDLTTQGESEQANSVLARKQREEEEEIRESQQSILLDQDTPPEMKQEAIIRLESEFQPASLADLDTEAALSSHLSYSPAVSTEAIYQEQTGNDLAQIVERNRKTQELIIQSLGEVSENLMSPTLSTIADVGGIIAPLASGDLWASVIKDVFPEDTDTIYDHVLAGESLKYIKDKVAQAGDNRYELVEQILTSIKDNAGVLDSNDMLAAIGISQAFSSELGLEDPDSFDWDRTIENIVGVLDASFVGILGAKVIKAGMLSSVGKVAGIVETTNPTKAASLHAANITQESPKVSEAIGLSPAESYLRVMPGSKADIGTVPPDSVFSQLELTRKAGNEILDDLTYGINFTEAEKAASQTQIAKVLTEETGGGVRLSRSSFTPNSEGVVGNIVVGQSDELPFTTIADAKDASRIAFGKDSSVKMLWENPKTGLLEDVPAWVENTVPGKYYYQTEKNFQYNAGLFAEVDSLTFGGEAYHHSSFVPNIMRDANAKFGSLLRRTAIRADDFSKGIEDRMLKMAQPFTDLGDKSKLRVAQWLDEGSRDEKVFSYYDLVGRGASDSEVAAYYAKRYIEDTAYQINDLRMKSHLERQGHKHVYNTSNNWEAFGKPMANPNKQMEVFNPTTRTIETMRAEEISKLYDEGDTLVTLANSERSGNQMVNVAIARKGENTNVGALPQNVLAYRPGYQTRIYKDNYFITRTEEVVVNGVKQEKASAVYTAPNKAAAERLASRLSDETGVKHQAQLDRALQENAIDAELSLLNNTGGLITGKRNEHLKAIDDTKAIITDPMESLVRNVKITSRKAGHDEAVQTLKLRMLNEYADVLPKREGKAYLPDNPKEIRAKTATDKRVMEAREVLDMIKTLEHVKNPVAAEWRGAVTKTSEYLADKGWEKASEVVLRNGLAKDPFQFTRGVTFNTLLGLNPARQLILQTNQATFLLGSEGTGMFRFDKLARDLLGMQMGHAAMDIPKLWPKMRKAGAKAMGMKEADYEIFMKGWRKSGLPAAIDSHTYGRDGLVQWTQSVASSKAQSLAKYAGNGLKAPVKFARQVGFDAGEWNNLAMSYGAAHRRWIKLNPNKDWRTPTHLDEIGVMARELALNMTKSGEFFYQEGWLSLMTQFHSFQHKALLAVLPKSAGGSQVLSRAEKSRMIAAQMMMYGLDGLGLTAAYEKARDSLGLDIPKEVEPFLNGIVYDYAYNKAIQKLTGDDTNLDITKSIAPGSGNIDHFLDLAINATNMSAPELFFGASGSVFSRSMDIFRNVGLYMSYEGLSTPEKLETALKEMSTIASGMNNYWKAQAAMNIGAAVSRAGDPVLKQTYTESFATIFGITSEELSEYYKTAKGVYGTYNAKDKDDDLKEIADQYYEAMTRRISYFMDDAPENMDELAYQRARESVQVEKMILDALPEQDADRVLMHLRKKINLSVESGTDRLLDNIVKMSTRNSSMDDAQYNINLIRNRMVKSGMITEQQAEDTIKYIEYMIGMEE